MQTTAMSITPIAYALQDTSPKWTSVNGMTIALEISGSETEGQYQRIAGITDVSCLQRFSVKGPHAAQWLQERDIPIPQVNSWLAFGKADVTRSLVLRLGTSEFLVEDQLDGGACDALSQAALQQPVAAGVYKVQRNDAAFMLTGSEVLNLMSELCLLDLREKAFPEGALVMTQVAGISATLLRLSVKSEDGTKETRYRLWCDGTYGAYMWETLTTLASELGGGAVGLGLYL